MAVRNKNTFYPIFPSKKFFICRVLENNGILRGKGVAHTWYVQKYASGGPFCCTCLPENAVFGQFAGGMYRRIALQRIFFAHTRYVQRLQKQSCVCEKGKFLCQQKIYIPCMCSPPTLHTISRREPVLTGKQKEAHTRYVPPPSLGFCNSLAQRTAGATQLLRPSAR